MLYSIMLTANLRAQIDNGDPGLKIKITFVIQGYHLALTILLASIVIDIIAIFCENSPIF